MDRFDALGDSGDMSIEFEFQNLNIGPGPGSSTGVVDDVAAGIRREHIQGLTKQIFDLSRDPPHDARVGGFLRQELEDIASRCVDLGVKKFVDRDTSFTPLHNAVKRSNEVLVRAILDTRRDFYGTVNDRTGKGSTPLHLAASNGHEATVKTLVEAGSELGALNAKRETPLMIATRKKRPRAVLRLLGGGDGDSDSDSDGLEVTGQVAPEEAEEQRLQRAKDQGNFFDLTSGEGGNDGEDEWWIAEDEDERQKLDEIQEKRKTQIQKHAENPKQPCQYNNCLSTFIRRLAERKVKFKVFGGAAYVHHACEGKSAEEDGESPCRTHDVDLYLNDNQANLDLFFDILETLKTDFEFSDLETEERDAFYGHRALFIKWKVDGVEHGVDAHFVGDEVKVSDKRLPVRLWDGWRDDDETRHYLSKEIMCDTLGEMLEGGASSLDGENKGIRRLNRYERTCKKKS